MPRIDVPKAYHPNLKFRYRAIMEGVPDMRFFARSIDLPTWDETAGWSTPIKIGCYHFEGLTAVQLYNVKRKEVALDIQMLGPAENVLYTWKIVGDIVRIKFGECDYGIDDVIQAEVTFVATKVEFEFIPKTAEIE